LRNEPEDTTENDCQDEQRRGCSDEKHMTHGSSFPRCEKNTGVADHATRNPEKYRDARQGDHTTMMHYGRNLHSHPFFCHPNAQQEPRCTPEGRGASA
jgi:hypothetical protein